MAKKEISTFDEFWDYYVGEHLHPTTRALHFMGTTAAFGCLVGGVLTGRRWLFALAPVMGYGPAWIGHFLVEKNRPATFSYPLWSLRADFVMWWKMLNGRMEEEVERVSRARASRDSVEIEGDGPTARTGAIH